MNSKHINDLFKYGNRLTVVRMKRTPYTKARIGGETAIGDSPVDAMEKLFNILSGRQANEGIQDDE